MRDLRSFVLSFTIGFLALLTAGGTPLRAAEPEGRHYEVQVDGMSCPAGCASRVRELIAGIDGVRAVQVDFAKKTAAVDVRAGATLTPDAVNAAFAGTPYTAKAISERP